MTRGFDRFLVGIFLLVPLTACSQSLPASVGNGGGTLPHPAAIEPAFTYRLLHSFGHGADGFSPTGRLVVLNGRLYGTTQYGGGKGNGTVFRVSDGGGEIIVHAFGKVPDGQQPVAALIDVGGTLYGTTEAGGAYNQGTVFSISVAKSGKYTEKVIHSFGAGNDGANPMAGLVAIEKGTTTELYGTTNAGGIYSGKGTVFEISTAGSNAEKVLHSFGQGSDGAAPQAGLVVRGNVLYGTTSAGGGSSNDGTIFSIRVSGREKVLYSFDCTSGTDPVATLTRLGSVLYGTAATGGSANCTTEYGSAFSINTSGTFRTVYDFGALPDGQVPKSTLTNVDGTFYSTTYSGGANSLGTIFSLTPAGLETVLHSFGTATDGSKPAANPIRMGITFYGTTTAGGKYGGGVVYAFTRR